MLVHEFIGMRKRVFIVLFWFFFGQYGVAPGSKRLDEKSYYSKPRDSLQLKQEIVRMGTGY